MTFSDLVGKEPTIAQGVFIAPGARVVGAVTIGERTSIWFNAVLRGDMAEIKVGSESNLQDNATVHVDFNSPTIIGNKVTVGHGAILHGCTVEDGALIGMGSIILNGAVIGSDSLIGAGALVTPGTVIPPRSLVLGSPGKVVKTLDQDQVPTAAGMHINYLELAKVYLEKG